MVKKSVIGSILLVSSTTTSFSCQTKDHFKMIVNQVPYQVEVCRQVPISGDRSMDMLKGMIVGGVLGNNIKGEENGGLIGSVVGGMLGRENSTSNGGCSRIGYETRYNETLPKYSHSTVTSLTMGNHIRVNFKNSEIRCLKSVPFRRSSQITIQGVL